MRWTKRRIFMSIWLLFVLCVNIWYWHSFRAKGVSANVFQSDGRVAVEVTTDLMTFTPNDGYSKVFLFYPGAFVDPKAYAPLCRTIAAQGYKSILIKMPWRVALWGYNKPKQLGLCADTSKQYILAGHSQGGRMAAQFVYENPGVIDKLILMATTHPREIDLSKCHIEIMKLYASEDGVASTRDVDANRSKLPATARFFLIEGGNHSQFGYYGFQLGDNRASLSRMEQQTIIAENILAFIR
jgi:hypothetical protein